jgi:hypothetical protein
MKLLNISLISFLVASGLAQAQLPASAISNLTLNIYGLYTTADASCQTGLVATIPLATTATAFNFATSPTLGTGSVSSPINCVVLVLKDTTTIVYSAGTYTTTSTGGGGTNNDSNCALGGTLTQKICRSTPVTFPTQIVTDAAAIGLTLSSSCPASPAGTEVIPAYLSANAACTGVTSLDSGNAGCVTTDSGNGPNAFAAPTAAGDTTNGIKLTQLAGAGGSYKFVVSVSNSVGGEGSGTCGAINAPTFAITQ